MPVIYKITNLANSKFYIGSAVNFSKRKSVHLGDLRKSRHSNIHLQRSYNKYGESNFKFDILETITDPNSLLEREQSYLDILKPDYNICKIAGSTLGFKHNQEFKDKCRARRLGTKQSEETKAKMRIINKGRKNTIEVINKMKLAKQNISLETKLKMRESSPRNITVKITDTRDNSIIEVKSGRQAARELKVSQACISNAIKNNYTIRSFYKVSFREGVLVA